MDFFALFLLRFGEKFCNLGVKGADSRVQQAKVQISFLRAKGWSWERHLTSLSLTDLLGLRLTACDSKSETTASEMCQDLYFYPKEVWHDVQDLYGSSIYPPHRDLPSTVCSNIPRCGFLPSPKWLWKLHPLHVHSRYQYDGKLKCWFLTPSWG